ncbi:hypothetical protein [Fimbriimonas ginsengisoli]|uniref:Uncharacterized protein n=1 Tax=Fimbriimonas ginsengisoli Gsoil 348 TaxID=661478 RepID=A0A068NLY5_FIMGI|nr:hypothetical protein [Fimbriimonas ginsengisoli]AIE84432.1 hypothetical protein OP10G_1064 [Fimbriimonas ginsengisoli Gsoil 348]
MNYRKLDAALASVVDDLSYPVEVSVRTQRAPTQTEATALARLGVELPSLERPVFTATLNRKGIGFLSEEDWVLKISLCQPLQYLKPA